MTDREQFEAWASDNGAWPKAIERDGEGYKFMGTHQKWGAWKAARNIQEMQPQAEAVPSGYVLVPVEPTNEFLRAVFDFKIEVEGGGEQTLWPSEHFAIYRAMIAAAIAQQKTK